MSATIRQQLEALRRKYARTFGVSVESVRTAETVNADGREGGEVWADGLPRWTLA